MLVDENVINEIYQDARETRIQKAMLYVRTGRTKIEKVHYDSPEQFEITGKVTGQEIYRTHISVNNGEIEDVTCECVDYQNRYAACKHIVATMIEFNQNSKYEEIIQNEDSKNINKVLQLEAKYRNFKQIVNDFYTEEMQNIEVEEEKEEKEKIRIEPKLIYDKYTNTLKLEFKIGNQRMYKIKNISEFYYRFLQKEIYRYGNKLEFVHQKLNFAEEDRKLLEFILDQAENINFVNKISNSVYRYYGKVMSESNIVLNSSGIDKLFELLNGRKLLFQKEYAEEKLELVDKNPDIFFLVKKNKNKEYKITLNKDINIFRDLQLLNGREYKYIIFENKLYRCNKEYEETVIKLLNMLRENYLSELILSEEQLPELFSVIMPKVKDGLKIDNIDKAKIEQYKPQKLGVKIFLDIDENGYILADVKFCYGEEEFNPLQEEIHIKYARDIMAENKAINIFRKTGFMYYEEKDCFILPEEDKIYNFLSNDINEYMQKFEVMVTDNFKSKEIKQPKIGSLGVKIENNLLEIDVSNLNIDIEELQEIMQKYNLKKKYHKLKDGTFINLEENPDIEFIDKLVTGLDITYEALKEKEIRMPVNRSLYLNQLLKTIKNVPINKNEEYKKIVNGIERENIEDEIKVPQSIEKTLRYYQKTGYKWLKTLDNYKFGGILADDMGLGNTIQMLSVILGELDENKEKRASIVICPSSLTLNWQNEANKFTNSIKTLVIKGTAEERKTQIKEVNKYDLIITSYDLLKRDIEIYKEEKYQFRFAIADEAQYLKNSNTQNAKAVKTIMADTRYALTGTPIENSLSELWSIFDYIMPGYLFSYKKFKTIYETPIVKDNDLKAMNKLKMLIEQFVLRRAKKEVLK